MSSVQASADELAGNTPSIMDPEAATPEAVPVPWQAEEFYPERPTDAGEWGYTLKGVSYGCTLEELRSYVAWDRGKRISLVWTPDVGHMLPPEEVPALLGAVQHREVVFARQQVRLFLVITVWWGVLAFVMAIARTSTSGIDLITYLIMPLVFGVIPGAQYAWMLYRARTRPLTLQGSLDAGQLVRYRHWLTRHSARFTVSFIVALSAVGLMQIYTSIQHLFDNIGVRRVEPARVWSAIDAAGLVKPAVWKGEIWRLFTGPMLHGSIGHFVLNIIALYAFGKVVEVLVGRAYLAIVFFLSAFAGSVLSLLLVPETSVGASGGIMGIVGFLAVLGYYNGPNLPPGFLKSMLSTVALVAVFGLVAFALVDNAAHAGGVACGALLGYLLLPHRPTPLPLKTARLVTALGWLCAGGIAASVVGSIVAMVIWG